jgi:Domain of unknown function (DUF1707)
MAISPGDEPAAAGRDRLRASHADREQAIEMLKAAFVQGMLAKDEFDARVSQAFASRTYADLAALTADLPAGLAAAKPTHPAPAQGEQKAVRPGRWVAVSTAAYAGDWAYVVFLSPNGGDNHWFPPLIFGGGLVYLGMLIACGGAVIVNWQDRRSGKQPPRRPAPGVRGQASRLPSTDPDGQLPPAGPGQQQNAEAAPIRRPLLPGWRPQPTTGYLTHPA